jgi:hypothetical protein
MKNWIIKQKPRPDGGGDADNSSRSMGGVNSVLASSPDETDPIILPANYAIETINEEPIDDNFGNVEFDLLEECNSLEVMTISEQVSPYSHLNIPVGSVRSVSSSQVIEDHPQKPYLSTFDVIIDSGCTRHMFPFREAFTTYKPTPKSYVILADKSTPCLGSGTIIFTLQDKNITLHDVLHVLKLLSPLLSIRCFRRLIGCSFLADNTGSFLTFPNFFLTVNDSSDCTISG